jgi:glutamate carboxypeptidase
MMPTPSFDFMKLKLKAWCLINSGSSHLQGLLQMQETLSNAFKPIADEIQVIPCPPAKTYNMTGHKTLMSLGNNLLIRKRPHLKRRILLSGHYDTVYSENHPFQHITETNNDRWVGPGVADMKGGLVVIHQALTTFETTEEAKTLGWDLMISADEEIGSPGSASWMTDHAKHYQAALVYEPAMNDEGMFARDRKGSGKFTLIVTGLSAHAGRDFYSGRNAISYLAQIIQKIEKLNHQQSQVTINIGRIAGGDALNVVPDKAVIQMDIRITESKDEAWIMQSLEDILTEYRISPYTVTLHGHFHRPVKIISDKTIELFRQIQTIGESMNLDLNWKPSGGCCDGNNLAALGVPVIDTLGVRGGHLHSEKEYIILSSLLERATLSRLLLSELAQGGLERL